MTIYKIFIYLMDKTNGAEINSPEYFEAESKEMAEENAEKFGKEIEEVEKDFMFLGCEVVEELEAKKVVSHSNGRVIAMASSRVI